MALTSQQEGGGCVEVADEASNNGAEVAVILDKMELSQEHCYISKNQGDCKVHPDDVELLPKISKLKLILHFICKNDDYEDLRGEEYDDDKDDEDYGGHNVSNQLGDIEPAFLIILIRLLNQLCNDCIGAKLVRDTGGPQLVYLHGLNTLCVPGSILTNTRVPDSTMPFQNCGDFLILVKQKLSSTLSLVLCCKIYQEALSIEQFWIWSTDWIKLFQVSIPSVCGCLYGHNPAIKKDFL